MEKFLIGDSIHIGFKATSFQFGGALNSNFVNACDYLNLVVSLDENNIDR